MSASKGALFVIIGVVGKGEKKMILGNYNFKENKYQFNGHWFKPHWPADPFHMTIAECKQSLETAYNATPKGPKGILIVTQDKWEEIAKSYASWDGLAKFHYYDSVVAAGEIPNWVNSVNSWGNALIHEYAPGKVAYRGKEELLYQYFLDTTPPAPDPVTPTPEPTPEPVGLPAWVWVVIGALAVAVAFLLGKVF